MDEKDDFALAGAMTISKIAPYDMDELLGDDNDAVLLGADSPTGTLLAALTSDSAEHSVKRASSNSASRKRSKTRDSELSRSGSRSNKTPEQLRTPLIRWIEAASVGAPGFVDAHTSLLRAFDDDCDVAAQFLEDESCAALLLCHLKETADVNGVGTLPEKLEKLKSGFELLTAALEKAKPDEVTLPRTFCDVARSLHTLMLLKHLAPCTELLVFCKALALHNVDAETGAMQVLGARRVLEDYCDFPKACTETALRIGVSACEATDGATASAAEWVSPLFQCIENELLNFDGDVACVSSGAHNHADEPALTEAPSGEESESEAVRVLLAANAVATLLQNKCPNVLREVLAVRGVDTLLEAMGHPWSLSVLSKFAEIVQLVTFQGRSSGDTALTSDSAVQCLQICRHLLTACPSNAQIVTSCCLCLYALSGSYSPMILKAGVLKVLVAAVTQHHVSSDDMCRTSIEVLQSVAKALDEGWQALSSPEEIDFILLMGRRLTQREGEGGIATAAGASDDTLLAIVLRAIHSFCRESQTRTLVVVRGGAETCIACLTASPRVAEKKIAASIIRLLSDDCSSSAPSELNDALAQCIPALCKSVYSRDGAVVNSAMGSLHLIARSVPVLEKSVLTDVISTMVEYANAAATPTSTGGTDKPLAEEECGVLLLALLTLADLIVLRVRADTKERTSQGHAAVEPFRTSSRVVDLALRVFGRTKCARQEDATPTSTDNVAVACGYLVAAISFSGADARKELAENGGDRPVAIAVAQTLSPVIGSKEREMCREQWKLIQQLVEPSPYHASNLTAPTPKASTDGATSCPSALDTVSLLALTEKLELAVTSARFSAQREANERWRLTDISSLFRRLVESWEKDSRENIVNNAKQDSTRLSEIRALRKTISSAERKPVPLSSSGTFILPDGSFKKQRQQLDDLHFLVRDATVEAESDERKLLCTWRLSDAARNVENGEASHHAPSPCSTSHVLLPAAKNTECHSDPSADAEPPRRTQAGDYEEHPPPNGMHPHAPLRPSSACRSKPSTSRLGFRTPFAATPAPTLSASDSGVVRLKSRLMMLQTEINRMREDRQLNYSIIGRQRTELQLARSTILTLVRELATRGVDVRTLPSLQQDFNHANLNARF